MGTGVYVEVCAGAGGLGLGLHRAGWTGTGIELDADAAETYRRNVGPCLTADLSTTRAPHDADLACGGVPCQPFSSAGEGLGFADPRGTLFRELLRIADECRARALLIENVQGMVTRGAIGQVVAEVEAAGWRATWSMLNAADHGVPQFRKRLFVVAFRTVDARARFRWPEPTHGAPGNLFGLPPWPTVREALTLLPGAFRTGRVDGATGYNGQRLLDVDAPAPTVTARTNPELISRLDRPAPTISAGGTDHGGAEPLANAATRRAFLAELASAGLLDRCATTIDTTNRPSKAGHHASNKSGAVRLTPRQCARLQSFPDDFEFVGGTLKSLHRQIGNAVPPLLGEALGRAVHRALYPAHAERGAA